MNAESPLHKLLAAVPLFHELTPDELATFLSHCRQEEVPAGYVLIEQGERGRHLYAVMSGGLKVSRKAGEAEPVQLAVLRAGDVFGELALVDFGERSASVTTTEPCRLLRFDRLDVVKLPPMLLAKLYRNVGTLMAGRLRETNSLVSVLLAEKAPAAVAADDETQGSGFALPQQRTVIRR
ncbi:cyclic nucleotide-binding domain-containing protein [Chitinimonas viridis]|uniref:Cyclic nucleotide-binding domain-containing protein n=1 Tax=Chitinimonas viridis TaxID=664880 RepID=A0ABT8B7B0_9NEIS|nr:cyclic nucleotide-binding domain-containing protein [Chitinimonas viridis]MDN3578153.1 cyclic nucleotide-binding domain-containing protein [Chitinimonas viridis]